jgi:predicted RNase H-like nuclease
MRVRAVGADAYVRGWVAVSIEDGRAGRVWSGDSLDSVLAEEPSSTVVGVDLPLGGLNAGWRSADLAAKRLLGSQHSKVFMVPPRPVWTLPTHAEANVLCHQLAGKGLSVQAYRLLPKMLEAERYRDSGPHDLREIHPELVFRALEGKLLAYGKKTWNGQMARRSLLARTGVVLSDALADAADVPANDVLDAAAVAWGAYRIARGDRRYVPDPADQYDDRGRPIVIWY